MIEPLLSLAKSSGAFMISPTAITFWSIYDSNIQVERPEDIIHQKMAKNSRKETILNLLWGQH